MSSGKNDCILAYGPSEDLYDYLGTLFSDLKPGDKEVGLLHVGSVSIIEPVEDALVAETDPYRPDIKTRKTVREPRISLRLKLKI